MATRNPDTVDWLPSKHQLPTAASTDIAAAAARDLITSLMQTATESPLTKLYTHQREDLIRLARIFQITTEQEIEETPICTALPRVPKALPQPTVTETLPRVPTPKITHKKYKK